VSSDRDTAVALVTAVRARTDLRDDGRGFTMGSEEWYRRRGPPVVRREFMKSRHDMDWASQAYAIVVPVLRKEFGVAARGEAAHRVKGAVALRRLA
jgi:hypothetical protein